jgi:ribose-phosphate pyrophosphokinase
LNKVRSEHNVSEVTHVVGDVASKTPILYDDMIDTAGSVCNARDALIDAGANDEVYLAATHAVFSDPACERLSQAGFAEVVVTDSIPLGRKDVANLKVLSLAPLTAKIIGNIVGEKPLSDVLGGEVK